MQALRSHDDQFDAMVNKLDLMEKRPSKMEVVAITGEPKANTKTLGKKDKSVIHYNNSITLRGIPLEAYEYIVNGKSAIEWIMDRYQAYCASQYREH